MNKRYSNIYAKGILVLFAFFLFLLSFNVVYLCTTGKTLVSGANIRDQEKSQGSHKTTSIIQAKRGSIYSSDGETVANDVKKYSIYAVTRVTKTADNKPAYVVNKKKTAKQLAKVLDATEEYILGRLNSKIGQVEFGNAGKNLSSIDKETIEGFELPGIHFNESISRNYPFGDFASYQVGYAKVLEDDDPYTLSGQMGIEKSYDSYLSGTNGKKVYLANAKKAELPNGTISETDAIDGNDVYLTINSHLQTELDSLMKDMVKGAKATEASAAVMEAKTGRILAVSSYPSFDCNKRNFKDYQDRFLNYAFECGSVFKAFVFSNAVSDEVVNLSDTYMSGHFNYMAHGKLVKAIQDYNNGRGWGRITFEDGLIHSSNTAICNLLSKYVKMESLVDDYKSLGFFQYSEVDGMASGSGVAGYDGKTKSLEYYTTGFGQGSSVTSLQLMRGYSVFANDGKTVEPYFVDKVVNPNTNEVVYEGKSNYSKQIFTSKSMATMRKLLYKVVNDKKKSTTRNYSSDEIEIIGKTGTGEVAKNGKYLKDVNIHSFCGLAPYDDPQVEVVVWYKNKKGGTKYSGKLVKKILKSAYSVVNENTVEVKTTSYTLPSYINQSVDYSEKMLEDYGVQPIVIGDGSTVVSQYPEAGTKMNSTSRVLFLTDGDTKKMISLKGWSRKDAQAYARLANIELTFKGSGTIYKQSVSKGTTLKKKQKVTVYAK